MAPKTPQQQPSKQDKSQRARRPQSKPPAQPQQPQQKRVPKAAYKPWTPAELDALSTITAEDIAAAQSAPILTPKLKGMLNAKADDATTDNAEQRKD